MLIIIRGRVSWVAVWGTVVVMAIVVVVTITVVTITIITHTATPAITTVARPPATTNPLQ